LNCPGNGIRGGLPDADVAFATPVEPASPVVDISVLSAEVVEQGCKPEIDVEAKHEAEVLEVVLV
jgi:hypothetical protein